MLKNLYFLSTYNSFNLLLINIALLHLPALAIIYTIFLCIIYLHKKQPQAAIWLLVLTIFLQSLFALQTTQRPFVALNDVKEVTLVLASDALPNALGYASVKAHSLILANDQWQVFNRLNIQLAFSGLQDPLYRGQILQVKVSTQRPLQHVWHINTRMNSTKFLGYSAKHWQLRRAVLDQIIAYIDQRLGYYGGLLLAVSLGNQSLLSPYFSQLFRQTGLAHLLALSGLHASFFVMIIYFIFARASSGLKLIILLIFSTLHLWLSGLPYTLMRAYLMAVLFLYVSTIYKKAKLLDILALSTILILLFDLNAQFSLSFQLSFLSLLGIALFYQPIKTLLRQLLPISFGYLTKLKVYIINTLAISFAVGLVINPLLLFHFDKIALFSPLANIIFPPLFIAHLLLSLIALIFGSLTIKWLASSQQLLQWTLQHLNLYLWQTPWQMATILHLALALSLIFWHNKFNGYAAKL